MSNMISHRATRPHLRGAMALAAVALGVLSIAGCGGSNDRRLANTVSDTNAPGAPGGDPASTPSTPPPPPPKKVSEECAALNTFQLLNYSIGLVDAQKEKDKKDEAVRALEASAAAAAGKAPELQSSLKMIVLKHKARFEGGGEPTPSAGDPTVKEAGEKLGAWAKDHDC